MADIRELMDALQYHSGYSHTCAVKCYVRDGVNRFNTQPVCKDKYRFALHVSKLVIANDNHEPHHEPH